MLRFVIVLLLLVHPYQLGLGRMNCTGFSRRSLRSGYVINRSSRPTSDDTTMMTDGTTGPGVGVSAVELTFSSGSGSWIGSWSRDSRRRIS